MWPYSALCRAAVHLLLMKRTNRRKSIWWTAFQAFWTASVYFWIVHGFLFLILFLSSRSILSQSCCIVFNLYLYKYENVCLCVCVCVCFRVFLGHLQSDWDTLWPKVAFWPRNGSKTIIFQKKFFFRVIALFLYFFKISP